MKKKLISLFALCALFVSCGEEILTQNTLSESYKAGDLETFQYSTCSAMRFVKPPVDILFVVDNSGSTLQSSFSQIKSQIAATVSTISSEFDYHVYIAPLHGNIGDIKNYPLVVSDVNSLTPPLTNYNLVELGNINSQTFFAQADGNNNEAGFQRVYDVISQNRSNGIFRNNANTIAVMISNGDDKEVINSGNGNYSFNQALFNQKKSNFESLANSLGADSFRFISLVPHNNCNGWTTYGNYRRMSQEVHDSPWSKISLEGKDGGKDSRDLCSGNYSSLFSVVNKSIRQQIQGHKYDHWKISSASASSIQANDITVTRISQNGSKTNIPVNTSNGFTYLGHRTGINTRYYPDAGEPVTGLVIKLNGDAKLSYPDCIIAKTRTPTEYFGYVVLPREPQLGTVKIEINGQDIAHGSSNGWSYEGYKLDSNIKVPGPTNAATTPAVKKTGYFIKLSGSAVFTNGDSISVYYKPKAI